MSLFGTEFSPFNKTLLLYLYFQILFMSHHMSTKRGSGPHVHRCSRKHVVVLAHGRWRARVAPAHRVLTFSVFPKYVPIRLGIFPIRLAAFPYSTWKCGALRASVRQRACPRACPWAMARPGSPTRPAARPAEGAAGGAAGHLQVFVCCVCVCVCVFVCMCVWSAAGGAAGHLQRTHPT